MEQFYFFGKKREIWNIFVPNVHLLFTLCRTFSTEIIYLNQLDLI